MINAYYTYSLLHSDKPHIINMLNKRKNVNAVKRLQSLNNFLRRRNYNLNINRNLPIFVVRYNHNNNNNINRNL